MPEGMRFPNNADLWRPLVPDADLEKRDTRSLGPVRPARQRCQPHGRADRVVRDCRAAARAYPDTNKNVDAQLQTFNERFNGGLIQVLVSSQR